MLDLSSNDLRCNVGASGANTQTVAVKAGDSITFTLDTAVTLQVGFRYYIVTGFNGSFSIWGRAVTTNVTGMREGLPPLAWTISSGTTNATVPPTIPQIATGASLAKQGHIRFMAVI